MKKILLTISILALLFIASCTELDKTTELEDNKDAPVLGGEDFCTSEDIARKACTREYMPVCGDNGVTYSNRCEACASEKVNIVTPRACEIETDMISVTDFNSCVKAGNPVMESYPEQCAHEGTTYTNELSKQELCENLNGGTFIESANECEGISKDTCENFGGTFNECASACRNDPDAMVCTMQCVIVCEMG